MFEFRYGGGRGRQILTRNQGGVWGPGEGEAMHRCPIPTHLYLRMLFMLFLTPLPRGPAKGPDCHFPNEIEGLGPIPARIRRGAYLVHYFWP